MSRNLPWCPECGGVTTERNESHLRYECIDCGFVEDTSWAISE